MGGQATGGAAGGSSFGGSFGGGGGFDFGSIFGGIAQAIGQQQQASAQAASIQAQAAGYQANARIAQMNAQAALDAGAENKERRERLSRANLASNAVQYLSSGVVLGGSPLAVLGEQAAQEALAAEDELYDQEIRANQFQNEATLQNFYAAQAEAKADAVSSSGGGFGAIGQSLLGAFSGGQ